MAIVFLICSPLSPFSLKASAQLFSSRFPSEKFSPSSLSPLNPSLIRASCYTDAVKPTVAAPLVKLDSEKYGKKQVISLTPQLYEYVLANVREPQVLRELRQETAGMRGSQMQVSPDQAQLLAILVEILGAVKCIEIGVYTGYSSLAIALALPDSGYLVACERDANCLEIAKKYYERAGVSEKVKIKHALAVDTLEQLIQNGECCSYDFAFVDAEKRMYDDYYELLLQLSSPFMGSSTGTKCCCCLAIGSPRAIHRRLLIGFLIPFATQKLPTHFMFQCSFVVLSALKHAATKKNCKTQSRSRYRRFAPRDPMSSKRIAGLEQ